MLESRTDISSPSRNVRLSQPLGMTSETERCAELGNWALISCSNREVLMSGVIDGMRVGSAFG